MAWILSDYAEDLHPAFGDLRDMVPGLVENNTVRGKLIAVPYFARSACSTIAAICWKNIIS